MKNQRLVPPCQALMLCLLLSGLAGCQAPYGPFDLRVDVPEAIEADVDANVVLTSQYGPVVATPLPPSKAGPCGNKIALIDVDGILVNSDIAGPYAVGENPVAAFHEKLTAVERQPCVCAVVVRINSPGGSVAASQIMRNELKAFRQRTGLPVVACLMDLATGGAYYLATESDLIVAQSATITGGIGVILNLYGLDEVLDQVSEDRTIRSGKKIDMGSPIRTLGGGSRRLLQQMADEFHQQFIDDVIHARQRSFDESTFDGRIFTASQALGQGLIDEVGLLDDALGLARQLASQSDAEVIMFRRKDQPTYSMYATTANTPLQASLSLINVPILTRSKLPSFLYMWQPEPGMERLGGK